jgi:hypothetical protein
MNGMDAGPIENLRPEARQEKISSSQEDIDPMPIKYHQECPQHLLHIVAMILTMVQDNDVTTIDAIEMVDVEDVEVERVVAMSTSLETQVVTPCLTSSYASDKYIILF